MLRCSENSSWFSLVLVFNLPEYFSYLYLSKYINPHDKIVWDSSTIPSPNIKYLYSLDSLLNTITFDWTQKEYRIKAQTYKNATNCVSLGSHLRALISQASSSLFSYHLLFPLNKQFWRVKFLDYSIKAKIGRLPVAHSTIPDTADIVQNTAICQVAMEGLTFSNWNYGKKICFIYDLLITEPVCHWIRCKDFKEMRASLRFTVLWQNKMPLPLETWSKWLEK